LARGEWEQNLFRAALAERLCAAGHGPVVATATHRAGKLVLSRWSPSQDTAYGQVFDETPIAAVRARLEHRLRDVGLEPTSIRISTPLQSAPMVEAVAADAAQFARNQDAVYRYVAGIHGDFSLYEGFYLAVHDARGSLLTVFASAARGAFARSYTRPDVQWPTRATMYPEPFLVPRGSNRWIRRPASLRISPTAVLTRLRYPKTLTRGTWGSGLLRTCGACRPAKVWVRLMHVEETGCWATVWRDVEVQRPGRPVWTFRIGDAPRCLVPPIPPRL
jgi:hypothetical protein